MRACRTCLSRHDLNPLFNELEFNSDQLFLATGIKISPNDGLPQVACNTCISMLSKILHFREVCSKVDTFFKTTGAHLTVKIEPIHFETVDQMFESLTNPLPDLDIDDSTKTNQNVQRFSQENDEINYLRAANENVELKHFIEVTDTNCTTEIKTDLNLDDENETTTTEFVNQENEHEIKTVNFVPSYINADKNIENNYQSCPKRPTNIRQIIKKITNARNTSNLSCVSQPDLAKTTSNISEINIETEDQNSCDERISNVNQCIPNISQSKIYVNQGRLVIDPVGLNTKQARPKINQKKPNINHRKPNQKSSVEIEGIRRNFFTELIKNLKERKNILMKAQKRTEEKLEIHGKVFNQETRVSKYKNITKSNADSHMRIFEERNKKLMALAVKPVDPKGPIQCRLCQRILMNKSSFRGHAKTHFKPEFVCHACGMLFTQRQQLRHHQQTRHGAEKQFACPQCSFRAADRNCMRNHVRAQHTGEKPYECDVCGMRFRMRNNIIQHLSIHFGIKNIQCELCASRFKRKAELWTHQQFTHFNFTSRHYCYMCPKTYRNVNDVRKHLVKVHGIQRDQQQQKIRRVKIKRNEEMPSNTTQPTGQG